jgi:hypothetical protein
MKKKFEVIFTYTQTSRASKIIEAETQEEAEEMADEMGCEDLDENDLNPIDGELYVDSVESLDEIDKE